MMPDLDGGDVAAALQGEPLLKDIPIIFLTAAVKQEEIKARDGVIGGFPYVAKPLNVKGVMEAIEKRLGDQTGLTPA
jgi:CheY-like chemotaxis protein